MYSIDFRRVCAKNKMNMVYAHLKKNAVKKTRVGLGGHPRFFSCTNSTSIIYNKNMLTLKNAPKRTKHFKTHKNVLKPQKTK